MSSPTARSPHSACQALSASARAQKQLQDLSNDLRKSTSNQFAEQMRNLRQQTRDLSEKHEELEKKLEDLPESKQRTAGERQRARSGETPRVELEPTRDSCASGRCRRESHQTRIGQRGHSVGEGIGAQLVDHPGRREQGIRRRKLIRSLAECGGVGRERDAVDRLIAPADR